jgi:2-C-methyl-D-erythritol 4-phosphate cytidylyltransferase
LAGLSVVGHTLQAMLAVERIDAALVVLAPEDRQFEQHAPDFTGPRAWSVRCGGATRAATVAAGLVQLRERGVMDQDWVLVHDAARCLLRPVWVDRLIDACLTDEVGGLLALPLADTLKAASGGRVAQTLQRVDKWLAQTPQMFRLGTLQGALARAEAMAVEVTDEASAVEAFGLKPLLVPGAAENFKLTWPADFEMAARLLETRR